MEDDQKFIEDVVKAIVDNPEKVTTARTIDERGVLIELTVAPEDMGKIIGKEGRTAKAIRTLLRVFGAKNDARLNLKIVEPEGSERPERREYDDNRRDDSSKEAVAEESTEETDEEPVEKKKNDVLDDIPEDVLG